MRGWFGLPQALERLRQTNARLDPKLIEAALERHRARSNPKPWRPPSNVQDAVRELALADLGDCMMTSVEAAAPLCWICRQNPADSAEHRIKASDVRARVPDLSPDTPVFVQRGGATNIAVRGARSRTLKFGQTICRRCNDTLTQPYDRAWQMLTGYLRPRWKQLVAAGRFDLSKPFPGHTREAALDVHLYFVKMFGCLIVEGNVQIDLKPFSDALLQRRALPELCLQIVTTSGTPAIVAARTTDVHTVQTQGGRIEWAAWIYDVPPIGVKVLYLRAGASWRPNRPIWHPSLPAKAVRIARLMSPSRS